MSDADRRCALVTGAASGIGAAVADRLRQDGLDVVAADLGEVEGGVVCDLATREGNRRAVDAALERHGRLDVIVANAGLQHVAPIASFPEDRWDRLLAVMLTSPFLLARYAWDALAAAPAGGRFIAIASAHGLVASPGKSAYVAAKHGLTGFIRTLALEGAAVGLSAVALCPGFVRTPLVERQLDDLAAERGVSRDEVLADLLTPHAVKRLLEPAEVAGAVAFLAGPEGAAFTGSPVPMDLGWTAR
jgi:3-hydroxybutyrate dehydrogenase